MRKDDWPLTSHSLGAWIEKAACRGTAQDPDAPGYVEWYPDLDEDESSEPAKAICRDCPVILECRAYAKESHEEWGVWGGLDEYDRGRPRPRRRRASQSSVRRPSAKVVQIKPTCPSCLSQSVVVPYDSSHLTCVVCRIIWPAPLR